MIIVYIVLGAAGLYVLHRQSNPKKPQMPDGWVSTRTDAQSVAVRESLRARQEQEARNREEREASEARLEVFAIARAEREKAKMMRRREQFERSLMSQDDEAAGAVREEPLI